MAWLDKLHHPEDYIKSFLKWALLGGLMGILGGLLGAGFHHALHFVTHVRSEHTWLIFLLPLGGILSVLVYRVLKMQGNRGTNEIIDAALEGKEVSPMVAPSIFLATAITHLFGGSAGREGAALQLGGSTASMLAKVFRLNKPAKQSQERKRKNFHSKKSTAKLSARTRIFCHPEYGVFFQIALPNISCSSISRYSSDTRP